MFWCQTKCHANLELGFIQFAESITLFGIFFKIKFDISAKPAEAKSAEVLGDKSTMYIRVSLY